MPDKHNQKTKKHWEGDLRKLEALYKDSEKKYWELIDLIPLGIFEYDSKDEEPFS